MCTFASEYNAMLDPALLESYDTLPQGTSGHWLGIDVGRTHDKTAIVQATGLNGTMYVEEITVLDKVEYSKQLEAVASLDKSKHFTGGYVDAGGIGSMLAEYANKQVSSRIKPLSFTGANKTPMYEALRDLVFRQKVKFAKHILEKVKQDIQQVSRVVNASGEVRYQASRSEAGHADMTSALVLCVEAFKKMPLSQESPVAFKIQSRLSPWKSRL